MKQYFTVAALMILLATGCARDSDVLATYRGGKITRADFHNRLRIRQLSMDVFRNKKEYQKKELEMMGLDRIAVIEAHNQGFDDLERFRFLWSDVRDRYLGTFLLEDIIRESGYREDAVKVSHIVFKLYGPTMGEAEKILKMAGDVIKRIEKGEAFEDLALKFSSDLTRDKGGAVGYIIRGMLPDEYTDAAFSLKKGGLTRKPVYLKERKRIFIIRADDRAMLTPDSIDRIITGKSLNSSIKKIIHRKVKNRFIEKLKTASDVKYDEEQLHAGNPEAIVFMIGDRICTAGEIQSRADMIRTISHVGKYGSVRNFNENVAERYFYSELLKREAVKRGIDKSEAFKQKLSDVRDFYVAGEYMEYLSSGIKKVTEKEIRAEYARNRDRIYYRQETRAGKQVRVPKPYSMVRAGIEETLGRMKGAKAKTEWMNGKLKEYDFVINMDELQGE